MGDVGLHAVHRLQVRLWVEVGVIEHDGVRRGECDAEPSRSRRAHEDLARCARDVGRHMGRHGGGIWEIEARYKGGHAGLELAPLGVELLDVDLALYAVGGAVEPRVRDACLGSGLGSGSGSGLVSGLGSGLRLGLGPNQGQGQG